MKVDKRPLPCERHHWHRHQSAGANLERAPCGALKVRTKRMAYMCCYCEKITTWLSPWNWIFVEYRPIWIGLEPPAKLANPGEIFIPGTGVVKHTPGEGVVPF